MQLTQNAMLRFLILLEKRASGCSFSKKDGILVRFLLFPLHTGLKGNFSFLLPKSIVMFPFGNTLFSTSFSKARFYLAGPIARPECLT
jgi:hypothetical protein